MRSPHQQRREQNFDSLDIRLEIRLESDEVHVAVALVPDHASPIGAPLGVALWLRRTDHPPRRIIHPDPPGGRHTSRVCSPLLWPRESSIAWRAISSCASVARALPSSSNVVDSAFASSALTFARIEPVQPGVPPRKGRLLPPLRGGRHQRLQHMQTQQDPQNMRPNAQCM